MAGLSNRKLAQLFKLAELAMPPCAGLAHRQQGGVMDELHR